MIAITIIMAALAAAAAVFAVMFFRDRKDAGKYESRAESLSKELNDLKCELARRESGGQDALVPLTMENIAQFLKREKTGEVETYKDENMILFGLAGVRFNIDCSRLPQQLILRKGVGGMEEINIHWDLLEQAAVNVMKSLVMVKMHVNPNEGYDIMIVSTTHTIAALREDYDFFMSLISDAEKQFHEDYLKLVEVYFPEECVDNQQESESTSAEDLAMKMAQMSAEQKKVQS